MIKTIYYSPNKLTILTPFVWQSSGGITAFLVILLTFVTLFIPYHLDYLASAAFNIDDGLHSNHFL